MMAGALQGRFLEFLVYSLGARRVLEIGTYSGYSALSMAAGLASDGRIDTCEIDEQRAEVARRYIARSPVRGSHHRAPRARARDDRAASTGEFDFVFIDADKTGYIDYYEAVLPRLSERGLIAADNTLSGGRAVDGSRPEIVAFNEHVRSDDRVMLRPAVRSATASRSSAAVHKGGQSVPLGA